MTGAETSGGWFRMEERPFIRRIEDWLGQVVARQSWKRTDFLTPREQYLLESLVRREGLAVAFWGGGDAERRRALVMPDDWYPQPEDFEVVLLRVSTDDPAGLTHGSLLGSLLGTGIERRKVGDIAVDGRQAVVAVCADVVDFLLGAWRQAGRSRLTVERWTGEGRLAPPRYIQEVVHVASLRADAVIAQACHWPRQRAQEAVHGGRVQLNFTPLSDPAATLDTGDMLSVRGFGRIRVGNVEGETKKGRVRLEVGVLKADT